MESIGMYVVAHKNAYFCREKNYHVIQVGNSSESFSKLRDNTGDNISEKNPSFCELTAMYWLWKNKPLEDYVGICHYRRYFYLNGYRKNDFFIVAESIKNINSKINTDRLLTIFKKYDLVLPKETYSYQTLYEMYSENHFEKDMQIALSVIEKMYPEYIHDANIVLNSNHGYHCNMMISSNKVFCSYMEWLFNILFEVEKKIDISGYNSYQKRVYGFLAERLFNVYVHHNKFKIYEVPYLYIKSSGEKIENQTLGYGYYILKYFPRPVYKLLKKIKNEVAR